MVFKRFNYLTLTLALLIALSGLAGCGMNDKTADSSSAASSGLFTRLAAYSSDDMDDTWDTADATKIALNGDSIQVNGAGASVSGSNVNITEAGTYILSGTLNDGQITIAAGKNDKVHLVLNGANVTCSNSSPLYTKQSGKTIITLAAGTANSVSDGEVYKNTSEEDAPDAAIFSQNDLIINGTGILTVNGKYKNGIGTKDDLVITGGKITINAANDGVRGRDSVAVKEGILTIQASSDGIQSNNQDKDKGWISLDGGTYNIKADKDCIQAETILQINGGKFNLASGGGSAKATIKKADDFAPGGRMTNNTATTEEESESTKALKGGTGIGISNGVLEIDAADDAIHSNIDVAIKGGTLNISTGDDAVHADSHVTIDGGTLKAVKSYEGLEGAFITINGGNVHITASDDGINAAGGNDGSGQQQGRDAFAAGNYEVKITGGNVYIDAGGDGLDSNGSLNIDGGTIIVNGPTNNGNGALDYNGTGKITGGILVAAGSSGMAQAPEDSSSQNSLLVFYTSVQKAGTLVTLSNESGESLLTFAPSKDYQSIVISTPKLQKGKTYTLSSGGTCNGKNVDGLYSGGKYTSGTKLTNITISSALTSISDDGSEVAPQSHMGSRGGRQPGNNGPEKEPGPGAPDGPPPTGDPQTSSNN